MTTAGGPNGQYSIHRVSPISGDARNHPNAYTGWACRLPRGSMTRRDAATGTLPPRMFAVARARNRRSARPRAREADDSPPPRTNVAGWCIVDVIRIAGKIDRCNQRLGDVRTELAARTTGPARD